MAINENEIKQKIKSILKNNPNITADQFVRKLNPIAPAIEFLDEAGLAQKLIFDTIKEILPYTFYGNEFTEILNLPQVEKISLGAFERSSLKEITIGQSLRSIESKAFSGAINLRKVVFSEGIKTIPEGCFQECTNLKEVYLPESIQYIGSDAFKECGDNLKIITPKRQPGSIFKCDEKDLEFLKPRIVFEEPQITESLNEAFSSSMPGWLKDQILNNKFLKRTFISSGIDLNKCRFEDRDVSTIKKRKDPIITDDRYIQVWLLKDPYTSQNKTIILPIMNNSRFGIGSKANTDCKYIPLKTFLEYAEHFCYIDTFNNNPKDLLNKKAERRANAKKSMKDRFTQKELPYYNLDKSGYIIPSISGLKDRLINKYGDSIVVEKLEKCHDDLTNLKNDILEIQSSMWMSDIDHIDNSSVEILKSAIQYFEYAIMYYNDAIQYARKLDNEDSKRYINKILSCLENSQSSVQTSRHYLNSRYVSLI